jgi:hypothetical protein
MLIAASREQADNIMDGLWLMWANTGQMADEPMAS